MKRYAMLLAITFCVPAYAADTAQSVLQCMRANVPGDLRVQDIALTTTDRAGGERTMKGKLYALLEKTGAGSGGLVRAMLHIEAPDNLAGASYLIRESKDYLSQGMYVYLPSVRRVRRVSGTFADGAMLGTNFSYNDFKQLQNAFVGQVAKLEGSSEVNGRPALVMLFKTQPGADTRYSSVRSWVDKQTCVVMKADFYEGDAVRKQLSAPAGALQKTGTTWYLSQIDMLDVQEKTSTTLRILGLSTARISSRHFDPNAFYLGN
jgi:hypothetical protein